MPPSHGLLLLTIDAWRADFADLFEGIPLLPSLAPYAERTSRLSNLYANAAWTTPALFSMFTGESVLRHGIQYAWSQPKPGMTGLAGLLRDKGFFVPNLCYLNNRAQYQSLGFAGGSAPLRPDSEDPSLFNGIAGAAREKKPFFLWYHYNLVHLPYWPEKTFRRLFGVEEVPEHLSLSVGSLRILPRKTWNFSAEDVPIIRRLYAAGVRQLDSWLERVFSQLKKEGLFDKTTIVITSDHGDELMEHGHIGHASTALHGHLFEEFLRVPCIVIDPRIKTPQAVSVRAEGRDLFPTLLRLADIKDARSAAVDFSGALLRGEIPRTDPHRLFCFQTARMGHLTPPEMEGQTVTALSDGRHKFICELFEQRTEALYDLGADPGEKNPVTEPSALADWRAKLAEIKESERK